MPGLGAAFAAQSAPKEGLFGAVIANYDAEQERLRKIEERKRAQELSAAISKKADDAANAARMNYVLARVPAEQRDAVSAQIASNPNAYWSNGKLYDTYDAYRAEHEQKVRDDAFAEARRQRQGEFDALDNVNATYRKLLTDRYKDEIKGQGGEEGFTDNALAVIQGRHQAELDRLQAAHDRATAALASAKTKSAKEKAQGDLETVAAQITDRQNMKANEEDAARYIGGGHLSKVAELERGVGADSKQILERLLVSDLAAERPDPRLSEGAREQAYQSSLGDIQELNRLDPAAGKMFLDQLAKDSKQGDAALTADQKDRLAGAANYTKMLTTSMASLQNLAAQRERLAAQKEIAAAKLKEAKRANLRKEALKAAEIEYDYFKTQLDNTTRELTANINANGRLLSGAAGNTATFTGQGKEALDNYYTLLNPGTAARQTRSQLLGWGPAASTREGDFVAEDAPLAPGTKRTPGDWLRPEKTELELRAAREAKRRALLSKGKKGNSGEKGNAPAPMTKEQELAAARKRMGL